MKLLNKLPLLGSILIASFASPLAPSAYALTITGSDTAPVTGADWEFYAIQTSWPSNPFLDENPANGQSFTVNNAAGTNYQLDAFTFIPSTGSLGNNPTDLQINIGKLTGTTFTSVFIGDATFASIRDKPYLTFNFDTPIQLESSASYAAVLSIKAGTPGWIGWSRPPPTAMRTAVMSTWPTEAPPSPFRTPIRTSAFTPTSPPRRCPSPQRRRLAGLAILGVAASRRRRRA